MEFQLLTFHNELQTSEKFIFVGGFYLGFFFPSGGCLTWMQSCNLTPNTSLMKIILNESVPSIVLGT